MRNQVSFKVWGRQAMFTDPLTRVGGEKCSYHFPTYGALQGVCESVYWKPTFVWRVDRVRVLNSVRTQAKSMKPLGTLSYYTYLKDVAYQVDAHFEWNAYRPELKADRVGGKHLAIAKRSLEKGGRRDIFLGTRECQAYVEPCEFGEGKGAYDDVSELGYGLVFHSFGYPDEIGGSEMVTRFHRAVLEAGVLNFPRPEDCMQKVIRETEAKKFQLGVNMCPVDREV